MIVWLNWIDLICPFVVFAAYWAKMADFGALGSAYWASYLPVIGPKVTYASAYWAKPN